MGLILLWMGAVLALANTIYQESLASLVNRSCFAKLKPSNLVLTVYNLLADLLICQIFFCQMLKKSIHKNFSPPNFPAI